MAFTLIVGPMKSGKSLELVARTAPYEFASKKVAYVKPSRDVRDPGIRSRAGVAVSAVPVATLADLKGDYEVISVDEVHMFPAADARVIRRWLKEGKEVLVSGLDLDYSSRLVPIVKALLELKPDKIITKLAVCELCHQYNAKFTQILYKDVPVLAGLPPVVPEDGTYSYQPRCADCFEYQEDEL